MDIDQNMEYVPNKPIRSFFALEIPDDTKNEIANLVQPLEKELNLNRAKWIVQEKWHITLRFLGNINQETQQRLAQQLAKLNDLSTFSINLHKIVLFPNKQNPNSIALIPESNQNLFDLANKINSFTDIIVNKKETRPFLPHLTICRLNKMKHKNKVAITIPEIKPITFSAEKITLLTSILEENRYLPLTTQNLN